MSTTRFTSRSRILAALAGKQADRPPVSPFVYTSWLETTAPAAVALLLRETDALIGLHLAPALHWLLGQEGLACWRREYDGDLVIDHLDTPRGPLRRVARLVERRRADRERNLSGPVDYMTDPVLKRTVQVVEWFCATPVELERLLSIPYVPPQLDLSEYRTWQERLGDDALLLPYCCDAFYLASRLFSPPDFRRLVADSGLMHDLLATLNERALAVARVAVAAGVTALCVIGPEYVFTLLDEPRRYTDLVAPYDTKLHDVMREAGAYVVVHMHGPVMGLLPEIAATRPHGLNPLEGPPGGDVDLAAAKRLVGDRLCLIGNLHDFTVLHDSRPAAVRRAALDCLAAAASGGGYILSGTHTGMYDETAVANWVRIARLVRRQARY